MRAIRTPGIAARYSPIASALVRSVVFIAIAMLLILVLLPAALGAVGAEVAGAA